MPTYSTVWEWLCKDGLWSEEEIAKEIEIWEKWLKEDSEAKLTDKISCPNCKKMVLAKGVCIRFGICHYCDMSCQPMIANPINKHLVDIYLRGLPQNIEEF